MIRLLPVIFCFLFLATRIPGAVANENVPIAQPATVALDSLIWISERAASDSLQNYWQSLNTDWYDPLTIEDLDFNTAFYDSLVGAGDRELGIMLAGRPWKFRKLLPSRLGFNRVQGAIAEIGLEITKAGPFQPSLIANLGYGFAWKRYSPRLRFSHPLIVDGKRDAQGRLIRNPWRKLEFEMAAGRTPRFFGGADQRLYDTSAVFSGYDPNNYYEEKSWRVGFVARPLLGLDFNAGLGWAEHRPLGVRTTWNLTGTDNYVDDNLLINGLTRRTVDVGLRLHGSEHEFEWTMSWSRLEDSPLTRVVSAPDGKAWYRRTMLRGWISRRDRLANIWVLNGKWNSVDHAAPLEWKTWLGDVGSLRGYDLLELGGDSGGSLSLDTRWNFDPFAALHVPILKNLRLRPISFIDYGRTYIRKGSVLPLGAVDWRADAGFGFGKMVGMIPEPIFLRVYAARPMWDDSGKRDWRFLMVFEVR